MNKKRDFTGREGIDLTEKEQDEKHTLVISKLELAELLCSAAAAQANISKRLMNDWLYHQTKKYMVAANAVVSKYKVYEIPASVLKPLPSEINKAIKELKDAPLNLKGQSPVKELDKLVEATKVPDSTPTPAVVKVEGIKIKINRPQP